MAFSFLKNFYHDSWPGSPTYTDADVPDLTDKVVIVTGANGGLGKHVSQALYAKNARVYMLARSEEQTREAMAAIKAAVPKSTGDLVFLHLDLADLTSVRKTADDFLRKERSLHLLFNNAGVGFPEKGSKTKQGYELQLGVNCIGPWALTKYLTPTLVSTAEISPPDTVRVVWVSSSVAVYASTKNFVQNLNPNESSANKYFVSKLGNYFQATEFASRHKSDGIISVSLNPGNLKTEFWRTQKGVMAFILNNFILYPSILGGYTLLFAGTSPKVTIRETGSYISPWGKFRRAPTGWVDASKSKSEGGTGAGLEFWDWTETQVKQHA